jgi:hypothetical protein
MYGRWRNKWVDVFINVEVEPLKCWKMHLGSSPSTEEKNPFTEEWRTKQTEVLKCQDRL